MGRVRHQVQGELTPVARFLGSPRLRVGIDMDGVVCDLHVPWLALYNKIFGDDLTKAMCTEYDLHNTVKPECGMRIYDLLNPLHRLYEAAPAVGGAIVAIQKLRELGHDVVFVTSTGRHLAADKRAWLERFGFIEAGGNHHAPNDSFVTMSDKGWLRADVLIEDNVNQLARFTGTRVLLEQPYNKAAEAPEGTIRCADWKAVLDLFRIGV